MIRCKPVDYLEIKQIYTPHHHHHHHHHHRHHHSFVVVIVEDFQSRELCKSKYREREGGVYLISFIYLYIRCDWISTLCSISSLIIRLILLLSFFLSFFFLFLFVSHTSISLINYRNNNNGNDNNDDQINGLQWNEGRFICSFC